jgi:hypothetical protein
MALVFSRVCVQAIARWEGPDAGRDTGVLATWEVDVKLITMRAIAAALGLCLALAAAPSASAQDDLDSLMESDRELAPGERHEDDGEDEEESSEDDFEMDGDGLDHEAPPTGWQGESEEPEKKADEE